MEARHLTTATTAGASNVSISLHYVTQLAITQCTSRAEAHSCPPKKRLTNYLTSILREHPSAQNEKVLMLLRWACVH